MRGLHSHGYAILDYCNYPTSIFLGTKIEVPRQGAVVRLRQDELSVEWRIGWNGHHNRYLTTIVPTM